MLYFSLQLRSEVPLLIAKFAISLPYYDSMKHRGVQNVVVFASFLCQTIEIGFFSISAEYCKHIRKFFSHLCLVVLKSYIHVRHLNHPCEASNQVKY